jgi:dTDP-glucose pyrophosphorylase
MAIYAKETVSVILGGGAGSRLSPLTASRSKPYQSPVNIDWLIFQLVIALIVI